QQQMHYINQRVPDPSNPPHPSPAIATVPKLKLVLGGGSGAAGRASIGSSLLGSTATAAPGPTGVRIFGNLPNTKMSGNDQTSSNSSSQLASRKFRESPFYQPTNVIFSRVFDCRTGQIDFRFTLNMEDMIRVKNNLGKRPPTEQLMIFVGPENGITQSSTPYPPAGSGIPVEYPVYKREGHTNSPAYCTILINAATVHSSFYMGIKGKPWSSQPLDVGKYLHKSASDSNSVEIHFTPAKRRLLINVQFVKRITVKEVADSIRGSKSISKDVILGKRKHDTMDDDVIAMSEMVTLKDPVTKCRITSPCRGSTCQHAQCFDLEFYLELNQTHPTWTCPVCSKFAVWKDLFVDGYFKEILETAAKLDDDDIESAEIAPDGSWKLVQPEEEKPAEKKTPVKKEKEKEIETLLLLSDDEDDGVSSGSRPPPPASTSSSTRMGTSTGATPKSAAKPKQAEVIDLTMSDDEDDRQPSLPPVRKVSSAPIPPTTSRSSQQPSIKSSSKQPENRPRQDSSQPPTSVGSPYSRQGSFTPQSSSSMPFLSNTGMDATSTFANEMRGFEFLSGLSSFSAAGSGGSGMLSQQQQRPQSPFLSSTSRPFSPQFASSSSSSTQQPIPTSSGVSFNTPATMLPNFGYPFMDSLLRGGISTPPVQKQQQQQQQQQQFTTTSTKQQQQQQQQQSNNNQFLQPSLSSSSLATERLSPILENQTLFSSSGGSFNNVNSQQQQQPSASTSSSSTSSTIPVPTATSNNLSSGAFASFGMNSSNSISSTSSNNNNSSNNGNNSSGMGGGISTSMNNAIAEFSAAAADDSAVAEETSTPTTVGGSQGVQQQQQVQQEQQSSDNGMDDFDIFAFHLGFGDGFGSGGGGDLNGNGNGSGGGSRHEGFGEDMLVDSDGQRGTKRGHLSDDHGSDTFNAEQLLELQSLIESATRSNGDREYGGNNDGMEEPPFKTHRIGQ
ncbi:SUMO ligase siz1, partial [Blyttiomyces sp. JEL0837]